MRSKLEARAAAIAKSMRPRGRSLTYLETALLEEIDRALAERDRATLAALDRLREKAGLPQSPRVHLQLRVVSQVRALIQKGSTARGAA